jgi:hypothetical protein
VRLAHLVVLQHEEVEALERVVLARDVLLEVLRGRADRLLEEREQELVLAGEVLVEAAQRLAGLLDDLLHRELLGVGVHHQVERGIEEPLHPLLRALPRGIERPGHRHLPPRAGGVGLRLLRHRGKRTPPLGRTLLLSRVNVVSIRGLRPPARR